MLIAALILLGLITGILAGLLGIGGGVITVPALYYLFLWMGYETENIVRCSIATALAATLLTSIGSTWAHAKKKTILPSVLKLTLPGLGLGSILGAITALYVPENSLRVIFGSMTLIFSVYFFFPKLPSLHIAPHPNRSLTLLSLSFGFLSSLLGIGGGIFMVPALLGYHVALQYAIAISSAGTLSTALIGSIAYLIIGWGQPSLPNTLGFIQIPAFLVVGICSFITTSLGVRLAHTMPHGHIKKIFALALAATGIAMIAR